MKSRTTTFLSTITLLLLLLAFLSPAVVWGNDESLDDPMMPIRYLKDDENIILYKEEGDDRRALTWTGFTNILSFLGKKKKNSSSNNSGGSSSSSGGSSSGGSSSSSSGDGDGDGDGDGGGDGGSNEVTSGTEMDVHRSVAPQARRVFNLVAAVAGAVAVATLVGAVIYKRRRDANAMPEAIDNGDGFVKKRLDLLEKGGGTLSEPKNPPPPTFLEMANTSTSGDYAQMD